MQLYKFGVLHKVSRGAFPGFCRRVTKNMLFASISCNMPVIYYFATFDDILCISEKKTFCWETEGLLLNISFLKESLNGSFIAICIEHVEVVFREELIWSCTESNESNFSILIPHDIGYLINLVEMESINLSAQGCSETIVCNIYDF